MIVAGDADGLPPSHAVEFFELLGGGKRDANWDRDSLPGLVIHAAFGGLPCAPTPAME